MARDNPIIFHSSPHSLQVLASAEVAALLWRHKIDTLDAFEEGAVPWSWIYGNQPFTCGDLLAQVPSAIVGLIDRSIKRNMERMISWSQDHSRQIFPAREERKVMAEIFYDIEIDDDDAVTGRRLLSCDRLTCEEKYRVAVRFCLENDIAKLWPSVSGNTTICDVSLAQNAMMYYWNCQMNKIPPHVPGDADDSIEFRLISHDYLLNYVAIEYLWRKINDEQRLSVVYDVLSRTVGNEKILVALLPKLNQAQARHVLETIGVQVIATLARKAGCGEHAIRVWSYFCEFASTKEQFEVLYEVFNSAYLPSHVIAIECCRLSEVVYELWCVAPESLVRHVVENHVEDVFDRLSDIETGMLECYDRDVRFFLDVFSRADVSIRNRIWCKHWFELIIIAKPSDLDRFIKLCFESDEQMATFKEVKMMDYDHLKDELDSFVESGYYDELNDYIRFCSDDAVRVQNIRRRIIASHFRVTILSDREKCLKFVKFIDDTFETAEQAGRFKEEFLTSDECDMLKDVYDNLDVGRLKNMINIRQFLYSPSCIDKIKQECLSHCKRCLTETKFMDFEVDVWREFVFWCCGSRDSWWQFRRSLPIDMIFDRLLIKVIKGIGRLKGDDKAQAWHSEMFDPTYEVLLSFRPVDNFFLWVYAKQEIVDNYKLAKFNNRSSRVIRTTLQKNWGKIVDVVLMWLLNNDKERVEEVKATISAEGNTSIVRAD